jgi:chromatin segregation and condensation protein Rec8/ScpA/Scc1 (kleisin family)
MEFTLKLDRFEGPYTKLLDLIESRKLSITEISLVDVADDYIAYIKTLDQKNIVDISQFIVQVVEARFAHSTESECCILDHTQRRPM